MISEIKFDTNSFKDLVDSTSDEIYCLQNDLIHIYEINHIIQDLIQNTKIENIEKETSKINIEIDNGNKDLVIVLKNENNNRINKVYGFILCIGILQSRFFTNIMQFFWK